MKINFGADKQELGDVNGNKLPDVLNYVKRGAKVDNK